jgi:hypothetical protein
VDGDAARTTDATISASEEQANSVGNVVERALVREDDLVDPTAVHFSRISSSSGRGIEPTPHPLETVPAHVVAQELAADPTLRGLAPASRQHLKPCLSWRPSCIAPRRLAVRIRMRIGPIIGKTGEANPL